MTSSRPTYWLSMHVPYACRHAGACCDSGWDIPIERSRVRAIAALRPQSVWLRPAAGAPADVAGVLALSDGRRCIFHHDGCEIQHALGHAALPSACQHFPREVLIDPRGVFVSLSHYCPTAADLLFADEGPVAIVKGPPVLPEGEPEGLDAREVLPPLLVSGRGRINVLMDYDGLSAWEAHTVAALTAASGSVDDALAQLDRDLVEIQAWRPGRESLASAVGTLSHAAEGDGSTDPVHVDGVIRRYLAARAFANWACYQDPEGIGAVLRSLRQTLGILRRELRHLPLKEAIRQTDLQVVHLAPRRT